MASRRGRSFALPRWRWRESSKRITRTLTEETDDIPEFATQAELDTYIAKLETEMREAAKKFEFERAAKLRDTVKELRTKEFLFS